MTQDQTRGLVERLRDASDGWSGDAVAVGADVAEEAATEIERLTRELEDAQSQIEELEQNAEVVSTEFEKDCWKAMRRLLDHCKFDWRNIDPGEGMAADDAFEYLKECIEQLESDRNRARSSALAAESSLSAAVEAEREACAKVAEAKAVEFLSPTYATGQPFSSFNERFACEQVASAIRSRAAGGNET